MACCSSLYKCILVFINLVFLLGGVVMLGLGIALLVSPDELLSFVSSTGLDFSTFEDASGGFFGDIIQACGIFMVVLGSVVSIIAFFGFCGACCDNNCLLTSYAIVLIVIVAVEISLIVFAAVYPDIFKDKGGEVLREALKVGFKSDVQLQDDGTFKNGTDSVSIAWMAIQFQFECCGGVNAADYNISGFTWNRFSCAPLVSGACPPRPPNYVVPISCCKLKSNQTGHIPTTTDAFDDYKQCLTMSGSAAANDEGCFEAMTNEATDFIKKYINIAIGVAAGIVAVEIMLIVVSCYLCCQKRK